MNIQYTQTYCKQRKWLYEASSYHEVTTWNKLERTHARNLIACLKNYDKKKKLHAKRINHKKLGSDINIIESIKRINEAEN